MNRPLVSVIMPVCNASAYLYEALNSTLYQTYKNIEVVIVDDACTDDSMDIVHSFYDKRIRVIRNTENIGLAASLNKAIQLAHGEYLARMDADDIAFPDRIEKQVTFFEQHPEVDVLGTAMQYIGHSTYLNFFPEHHEACKSFLVFNVCFGHPSVMLRKHVFSSRDNFYKAEYKQYSEEFDLWCRLVDRFRFHNLPEVLLYYRTFPPSIKGEAESFRKRNSAEVRRGYLSRKLNHFTEEEFAVHLKASQMESVDNLTALEQVDKWFSKLLSLNQQHLVFENSGFERQLAQRFFEICYHHSHLGLGAARLFTKSRWSKVYKPSQKLLTKFRVKIALKRK